MRGNRFANEFWDGFWDGVKGSPANGFYIRDKITPYLEGYARGRGDTYYDLSGFFEGVADARHDLRTKRIS